MAGLRLYPQASKNASEIKRRIMYSVKKNCNHHHSVSQTFNDIERRMI
jgi:hypothetical protein